MVTIQFSEKELELLKSSMSAARAHWCKLAVDALIEQNPDEPVFSSLYAQTVKLDNRITSAK